MCAPSIWSVVVGCLAVIGGLTLASYAAYFGFRTRNPLWFIEAAGSLVFVAGVVGQRAYYLGADQTAGGCSKTVSQHPGIWDADVTFIHLTFVSVIGIFVGVLGFCLMMFFEPSRPAHATPVPKPGDAS